MRSILGKFAQANGSMRSILGKFAQANGGYMRVHTRKNDRALRG